MEISNFYKKLRYFSNPNSLISTLFTFPSFSSSSSHKTLISSINPTFTLSTSQNPNPNLNSVRLSNLFCKKPNLNPFSSFFYSFQSISISSIASSSSSSLDISQRYFISTLYSLFRSFSTSSSHVSPLSTSPETQIDGEKSDIETSSRVVSDESRFNRRNLRRKVDYHKQNVNKFRITELVELIKRDENDLESKLNRMNERFSLSSIRDILGDLNRDGVSGFRFFQWVRETQHNFDRNSEFCSLGINNLGRVEDYETMLLLLKDFSRKGIVLTEKAFAFIPIYSSDGDLVQGSVKRVIEILNKAGGSCRNSGMHALIKMLCTFNSFDLAIFVMEETERKTSYYNVLIWAKCKSENFQEGLDLLDEMKRFSCDPNANSFNYLLGGLCKSGNNVEVCTILAIMEEKGYMPDAITFEVIIHYWCNQGKLDFAVKFLHQMISRGIEPRLTTHATFIKCYFHCDRFEEAYKYVVDMGVKYKCSANMNYSLLASLHQRKGRVIEAREILVDMMEKGIKPNFPVYVKVMKDLHKSGMGDLVADLKSRFSFIQEQKDG